MNRLLLAVAACSCRAPVQSCDQDLHGVWIAPGHQRWNVIDDGSVIEAYPMFDDTPGRTADVVVAPRVLEVDRASRAGEIRRRFMRRADLCLARAPIHLEACKDDELELVLADVPSPLDFGPCRWPASPPSRVERWHRE